MNEAAPGPPDSDWGRRGIERRAAPDWIRPLLWAEDALQFLVAIVLILIAAAVMFHALTEVLRHGQTFAVSVPNLINTVLFVVIVLELFGTVMSHFASGGFQLRPFLIIGIVSGVRHILSVGAKSTFNSTSIESVNASEFSRTMIEFGVNVAIIVGLVVALVLVSKFQSDSRE